MATIRAILVAAMACATSHCAPSAAPLSASAFDADAPLNPTLDDGRLIYRGYDDHHPTCFAFVSGDAGDTEELDCPAEALAILDACPSGRLFLRTDADGCVCDPIGDEPATPTACPE